MLAANQYIAWLSDVEAEDESVVGKKNAAMASLLQSNIPVPNGFILTRAAYDYFIRQNNLEQKIKHLFGTLNYEDPNSLSQVTLLAKRLITTSPIPEDLTKQIFSAYERFGQQRIAVRGTILPTHSHKALLSGKIHSYLNIQGEAALADTIRKAWASIFSPESVLFRHKEKLDHVKLEMAVLVQEEVEQDVSGTMFTIDPVKEDKSKIIIEAIWGYLSYVRQGKVIPDYYEVDKKVLEIFYKRICEQDIYLTNQNNEWIEQKIPKTDQAKQKLSDREILSLADLARQVEHEFYFPQEIEWAKGPKGIYILDIHPFTSPKKDTTSVTPDKGSENSIQHPILVGEAVSPGIGIGHVKIVKSVKEIGKVQNGDILVVPFTTPDYIQAMKKSVGIITEQGERISHAALVSQELGIPAVVGTVTATRVLKDKQVVTVNGRTGEVFAGSVYTVKKLESLERPAAVRTTTRLYANLAEPELAQEVAAKNVDGVGLLRGEYLIAQIGEHPKKFIRERRQKEFVQKLSDGIEKICRAFYPRPVLYRTTDFKTSEYRDLAGGKEFEPVESNPMLGYRGASRYIHEPKVLEMQAEAIKIIREKKGLHNLHLMLPFVRTPHELISVKRMLAGFGIKRSQSFKLFMMAEIPSNIILIEDFIRCGLDGVSIGSNDLTMLFLGVDRDNSEVARDFDERNKSLLWAYERVITTCRKYGIVSSICGQAPSQYPDLVEQLVKWGVNGISVAPDSVDAVRMTIYEAEKLYNK